MKFEQMNLIRPILRAIREVGYTEPTPIQEKTVPPVLRGRDVLGCAQTGTGKTAAFALPILQRVARAEDFDENGDRPIRALILTPTRELALQIHENFTQYGKYLPLRCAVIFGGVNQNPQVEQLRSGVDILVATPGRLNDLIGQGHISLRDIRIFVLDEADRMLDMGFIHDVRKVMAKLPAQRQTLLFSATMPPQVEEIAAQLLTDPIDVKISPVTSTVDSVAQSVYYIAKQDKTELLLYLLNGHGVSSALVFTRTKHGADAVARKLTKNGVKAMAIHGDKSQNARVTALNRFKAGEIDVLVATDIAARGIDIVELPTVINYNVPEEPETYIHRIGRTGRAGMEGVAITFCCSDELESFHDIEKLIQKTVTEQQCEWSVVDMQPTKPEPRGQNPRKREAVAEKKERAEGKPSGQKNVTGEKVPASQGSRGADHGQRKQPTSGKRQPASEKPTAKPAAKQTKRTDAKASDRRSDVPRTEDTTVRDQNAKQAQTQNQSQKQKHSPKPKKKPQGKPSSAKSAEQKEIAAKTAELRTVEAKKSESKQIEPRTSSVGKTQSREESSRRAEQAPRRRSAQEREKPKAAEPTVDRRYADSGEHDGATGQQIVTNFNRSVWLEFNEPPKRAKKPWLIVTSQVSSQESEKKDPVKSTDLSPEQKQPTEPASEKKTARGGVFSRFRKGKKQDRS